MPDPRAPGSSRIHDLAVMDEERFALKVYNALAGYAVRPSLQQIKFRTHPSVVGFAACLDGFGVFICHGATWNVVCSGYVGYGSDITEALADLDEKLILAALPDYPFF